MKKFAFLLVLLIISFQMSFAQKDTLTVNGVEKILNYSVKGELSLLVDQQDEKETLYLKKADKVEKLTAENYKSQLNNFTNDIYVDFDDTKFELSDIKSVVNKYNSIFNSIDVTPPVSVRLGLLGGSSNYTAYLPTAVDDQFLMGGISLEFYNEEKLNRHSVIFQVRNNLDQGDIDLNILEFGLGYRFKIINKENFHFYFETEFLNLHKVEFDESRLPDDLDFISETSSNYGIEPPLGLGFGMAYQVAKDLFLSLNYNNLYYIGLDDNGEFPVDVRFGIKYKL